MQLFKKTVEGLLLAGIFFLVFLLIFEDRMHLPAWLQVVGRMHPMFLHFPITLLLVYFVVFWIPANESASSWVQVIGFVAALSAVLTAIMGLLLSLQETFDGSTFQRHKWGGVSIAITACLFYYFYPWFIRKRNISRPLTLVAAVLILITGHWGGNLTHGENYLLEPYAKEKKTVPLDQAVAFADIIQPILQNKCGSCHSDGNSKGGLSLADTTGVQMGGKTGPFFVSGDPGESLFIQRILLPQGHKKHMAPASRPQLSDEEFQLLYAWVKSGAPMNKKILNLPKQDSFRLLASRSLAPVENSEQTAYTFPAADEKLVRSLNSNYRVVTPEGQQSPALEVQFYGAKVYTSKSLEDLLAVKEQITDLNLAKMPVKNEEMKVVQQMPNLGKLNINYTDITDAGIAHLAQMKNLKEITLSGTPVTAAGLEQLLKIPSLTTVFAWNTSVDSNAVAILQGKHKNVRIETGFKDDGQNILPLNPPVVKILSGVYEPNLVIQLTHPMKGAVIRYTLDQSEPDSINSQVYKEPFTLNDFTVIKAKAYKPTWYGSSTLKAVYFMKGPKPDSVSLESSENENNSKAKSLFDLETGDANVGSGKWIGFRKPVTCYMFFDHPVSVSKLSLNMFEDRKFKMLLPMKMELRGGIDKAHLKVLKIWESAPLPKEDGTAGIMQPSIEFKGAEIKCLQLIIQPWVIKKTDVQTFVSEIVLH